MKHRSLMEHEGLQCLNSFFCSYALKGMLAIKEGRTRAKATTAEYFTQAVYGRVGELDNTLASLRLALGFLKALSESADPDPEVYRYHYENFIFRGIGAVDRAFLLVADALQLSNRTRKSNQLIAEQVQGHPQVYAALLAVKATMEAYRKSRNVVIHDSAYSSRELAVLSGVRQLDLELPGIDVAEVSREAFAAGVQPVAQAIGELEASLNTLLGDLKPVFEFVAKWASERYPLCVDIHDSTSKGP
ncbi:Cthe_2314 family HEPN domain-containing protein [Pseudomonas sp. FYR_11]|uniref:Cthe_2314 family HEPN domain-containing protein n=1 Tax=Pseudomonas TaxID=286 RepID=UPI00370B84CB